MPPVVKCHAGEKNKQNIEKIKAMEIVLHKLKEKLNDF